jgi:hypothetical protein
MDYDKNLIVYFIVVFKEHREKTGYGAYRAEKQFLGQKPASALKICIRFQLAVLGGKVDIELVSRKFFKLLDLLWLKSKSFISIN